MLSHHTFSFYLIWDIQCFIIWKKTPATSQGKSKSQFSTGAWKMCPKLDKLKQFEMTVWETTGGVVENLIPNSFYPKRSQAKKKKEWEHLKLFPKPPQAVVSGELCSWVWAGTVLKDALFIGQLQQAVERMSMDR